MLAVKGVFHLEGKGEAELLQTTEVVRAER